MRSRANWIGLALVVGLAGCNEDGPSTAEVSNAAKEQVRAALNLRPESTLFTNVFIGEPRDGAVVFCGTVQGQTADGGTVAPRRFVMSTDPVRWLHFEKAEPEDLVDLTSTNIFVDQWANYCAGAEEVK